MALLDVSKAHAESVVEPDGVADDFRWKSIAVVAWRIGLHWTILSVTSSISNQAADCRSSIPPVLAERTHSHGEPFVAPCREAESKSILWRAPTWQRLEELNVRLRSLSEQCVRLPVSCCHGKRRKKYRNGAIRRQLGSDYYTVPKQKESRRGASWTESGLDGEGSIARVSRLSGRLMNLPRG